MKYQIDGLVAYWVVKQPYKTPLLFNSWINLQEKFEIKLQNWQPPTNFQGSLGIRVFRQISVFHGLGGSSCDLYTLNPQGQFDTLLRHVSPVLHRDTYPPMVINQDTATNQTDFVGDINVDYYQYISIPLLDHKLQQGGDYGITCPSLSIILNANIDPTDTAGLDYLQLTYETQDDFVTVNSNGDYVYSYDIFDPMSTRKVTPEQFKRRHPRPVYLNQNAKFSSILDFKVKPPAILSPRDKTHFKLYAILIGAALGGACLIGALIMFVCCKGTKLITGWCTDFSNWRTKRREAEENAIRDELLLEQMKTVGTKLHHVQMKHFRHNNNNFRPSPSGVSEGHAFLADGTDVSSYLGNSTSYTNQTLPPSLSNNSTQNTNNSHNLDYSQQVDEYGVPLTISSPPFDQNPHLYLNPLDDFGTHQDTTTITTLTSTSSGSSGLTNSSSTDGLNGKPHFVLYDMQKKQPIPPMTPHLLPTGYHPFDNSNPQSEMPRAPGTTNAYATLKPGKMKPTKSQKGSSVTLE